MINPNSAVKNALKNGVTTADVFHAVNEPAKDERNERNGEKGTSK